MRLAASLVLAWLLALQVAAQSRSALLGREGWQAIEKGDAGKAAVAFHEAITLDPGDATLQLGLGLATHLLGRESDARSALTRALEIDSRLMPAAVLLGQITYAAGELDAAIAAYERALTLAPDNTQIQSQLERWRKEAELHNSFQEQPGIRFRVLFEGPEEQQLAERVSTVLEAAYWRIGAALNQYPPETITVILYTQEQFHDITRSPGWAGGAFDGRIRVPVRNALQNLGELDRVVTHEFVHAVVRSLAPRGVPAWLNEGIAVVFEGGDPAWARDQVRKSRTPVPLTDLKRGFGRLDSREAAVAYAESALAAQFLFDRLGWSLSPFLQELGSGQDFDQVLARYDIAIEDLENALSAATRTNRSIIK